MYKHIKEEGSDFYELAMILADNDIKIAYCDIESNGLDPRNSKLITLQIMCNNEIYIYDFLNLERKHLEYILNLLNSKDIECVFHNAKFDIKFLYHNSGVWLNKVFDTMNCEVLINAGIGKSLYSLKDLAKKYCDIEMEKDARSQFYDKPVTEIDNNMLQYAAMDVKILEPIHKAQLELIEKAKENKVLQLEMDLLPAVAKMEYDGVVLDVEAWTILEQNERKRVEEFQKKIVNSIFDSIDYSVYPNALSVTDAVAIPVKTKRDRAALESITDSEQAKSWARDNFNISSNKQMLTALNLLGIECSTTNEKELKKFDNNQLIKDLLEYRESGKRVTTYGSNFLSMINPISGRIHTDFLNMGAATGRFSSMNPNLQNIPTAKGYRESFIASPDFDWISVDYSQQEYRLAGAVSSERVVIDAYLAGADMHTATAAIVFNKSMKDVTPDERKTGKTVNFAILYGSSEYGLKKNLGISLDRAKEIINAFFRGYPRLHSFKTLAEEMILKLGFSSTPMGRRRYNVEKPLFMGNHDYLNYMSRVKREGFNHIIQGGGADIVKIAMLNIYRNNPFGEKLRMLIQVHDELNVEAHKSISKDAVEFVREEMLKAEQPFLGEIPAKVDFKISNCWLH